MVGKSTALIAVVSKSTTLAEVVSKSTTSAKVAGKSTTLLAAVVGRLITLATVMGKSTTLVAVVGKSTMLLASVIGGPAVVVISTWLVVVVKFVGRTVVVKPTLMLAGTCNGLGGALPRVLTLALSGGNDRVVGASYHGANMPRIW